MIENGEPLAGKYTYNILRNRKMLYAGLYKLFNKLTKTVLLDEANIQYKY